MITAVIMYFYINTSHSYTYVQPAHFYENIKQCEDKMESVSVYRNVIYIRQCVRSWIAHRSPTLQKF